MQVYGDIGRMHWRPVCLSRGSLPKCSRPRITANLLLCLVFNLSSVAISPREDVAGNDHVLFSSALLAATVRLGSRHIAV